MVSYPKFDHYYTSRTAVTLTYKAPNTTTVFSLHVMIICNVVSLYRAETSAHMRDLIVRGSRGIAIALLFRQPPVIMGW